VEIDDEGTDARRRVLRVHASGADYRKTDEKNREVPHVRRQLYRFTRTNRLASVSMDR
jgi:hypothetical protein